MVGWNVINPSPMGFWRCTGRVQIVKSLSFLRLSLVTDQSVITRVLETSDSYSHMRRNICEPERCKFVRNKSTARSGH